MSDDQKTLRLRRETLRILTTDTLARIRGGWTTVTGTVTSEVCPTNTETIDCGELPLTEDNCLPTAGEGM